jgi:hypothetical protein
MYCLSESVFPVAACRVIEDIDLYNRFGGMEKQLSDVSMQIYTIESIARQNKAITALFKLQTYYGTTGGYTPFSQLFWKVWS